MTTPTPPKPGQPNYERAIDSKRQCFLCSHCPIVTCNKYDKKVSSYYVCDAFESDGTEG